MHACVCVRLLALCTHSVCPRTPPPPCRYAFDALAEQEQWTLAGMAARLPRGLAGMYQHVMKTLCEALQAERPDMLRLLREQLLPVLVAARDSLTVEQLGIAVGPSSADVSGGAEGGWVWCQGVAAPLLGFKVCDGCAFRF